MSAGQTNSDKILENERDIDRIDKMLSVVETKISIFMWAVPIVLVLAGLVIKLL